MNGKNFVTAEVLLWLAGHQATACMARFAATDPVMVVAQMRNSLGPEKARAIAHQLKLRQKALHKLPTWHEAGCLYMQQAYEQATPEAAARLVHAGHPEHRDSLVVDLTHGLGVDAWGLSAHFNAVVAAEPNPVLNTLAAINHKRLGMSSTQLFPESAEALLARLAGTPADLVFIDPDRRTGASPKAVRLADSEPDVLALLPKLFALAPKVWVKLSPLFEIVELKRQLPNLRRVRVVSVRGEVKLVLAELERGYAGRIAHVAQGTRYLSGGFEVADAGGLAHPPQIVAHGPVLLEPDAAIGKAGVLGALWQEMEARRGFLGVSHILGYGFAEHQIAGFPGRQMQVLEALPYKPRLLSDWLKARAIVAAHISARNFPQSVETLRKTLKLKENGAHYLFFSEAGERKAWVHVCAEM